MSTISGRFLPLLSPALLLAALAIPTQTKAAPKPNLFGNTARPLHFRPDGRTFLVENGPEFFNRPLYGGNTAFRVDAGDQPEFSMYLPGRGGNLRLGISTTTGKKWLFEAKDVRTRYVPGMMTYEIRDPLLGEGVLHLGIEAMNAAEGFVVRAELKGAKTPLELVWAYGGANGERASRNGDIGTEKLPVSQYFQLKPDYCRDSAFTLGENRFTLQTRRANLIGLAPTGATLGLGDARQWANLSALLASVKTDAGVALETPVAVGRATLKTAEPLFVSLERVGGGTEARTPAKNATYSNADLPRVWDEAERHRRQIADKVLVETPDPYINAAASALCVAADGIWDEETRAFMHGAVAWRSKLLGWRGPYTGDALGWPDRTHDHLMNWFPRQNVEPVAPGAGEPQKVPPSIRENYARNEPALHSNGDLSGNHYDMNLPAIDAFFRHILWTGDLKFARESWPVIERHLAWERRLFRRPFGPDKLPLYEAYVCIWASDDLQYEGGGVTHSSAYNYYHNLMAARIARALGKDPARYEREAALISKAMQRELWLPQSGMFAEWKDLLGLQRTHPNAALWTFYHTVDSQVPSPLEAWQMTRYVDTKIPHIAIHGPGVPQGNYFTLSTTSWMPYNWSINNVVMAESAHTSLGYWQAGRPDMAFRLFKGLLLDSMYLGLTPGNVGMCTYYDMARSESQRDFGDGVGTTSRAFIEGLFGVKPDALKGSVTLRPGFPTQWNTASIRHPNFGFRFKREGIRETYSFQPHFGRPMRLDLNVAALRDKVGSVTVNGKPASWKLVSDAVGTPRIQIQGTAAPKYEVVIQWEGASPAKATTPAVIEEGSHLQVEFGAARPLEVSDPQRALVSPKLSGNILNAKISGARGDHTAFVKVRQGDLSWWAPLAFETRPAFEIMPSEQQTPRDLRWRVRNNTRTPIDRDVMVSIGGRTTKVRLKAPALAQSAEMSLPATGLVPGSNRLEIGLGQGKVVSGVVTNWKLAASDSPRWETVDLQPLLNAKVTQIFKNAYLSPRSPYTSLAIPLHGYGTWTAPTKSFDVDDSGLRAIAAQGNDKLVLPQGVPFQTSGAAQSRNIAFTSRWDNYPKQVDVPLSGRASHLYLLMAGSTNPMQSRFDNGEVVVHYTDGTTERLALENPTTWWPIDQDYLIDDYAFRRPQAIPPRVDLQSGEVRTPDIATFKGQGGKVTGGAATVLDLPLQPAKTLKSFTVRTLANEVVIGLMSATLVRP